MPITFSLVERTPLRLRYLCQGGAETISPDSGILVNRNGVTPDLRGDTASLRGFPIQQVCATPVANQAAARRLLFGDALTARLDLEIPRAHCTIFARSSNAVENACWSIDADEGAAAGDVASAGFAVITVLGPLGLLQFAYLEINFEHTYDR